MRGAMVDSPDRGVLVVPVGADVDAFLRGVEFKDRREKFGFFHHFQKFETHFTKTNSALPQYKPFEKEQPRDCMFT